MSERVTWETCPTCGRPAAVGRVNGVPVEVDCSGGCLLTAEDVSRQESGNNGGASSVDRWATVVDRWL